MLEQLKSMKECLINSVQNQLNGNLDQVNAKELGEAIDMIKDLSKSIYYCTIVDAMEKKDEEEKYQKYAQKSQSNGMMYYDGGSSRGDSWSAGRKMSSGYPMYPMISDGKDMHEGRSPMYRKMYMENKMMHDKAKSMQDLDAYMQELSSDLVDMIQDASPEEKQLLQQKINTLATKIK